jgi:hypothetical protein
MTKCGRVILSQQVLPAWISTFESMPHALRLGDSMSSTASRAHGAEPSVQNSYIDTTIVFQIIEAKDWPPKKPGFPTTSRSQVVDSKKGGLPCLETSDPNLSITNARHFRFTPRPRRLIYGPAGSSGNRRDLRG